MFKHILLTACLLTAACAMGYWPEVAGTVDQAKYQADVRDCQTETHKAGAADLLGGGLILAAISADQSKSPEQKAAIDACMAARGYTISRP